LKQELSELRPDVVHVLYGMTLAHILADVPETYIRVWSIMNVPPQEYSFNRFAGVPLVNEFLKRSYFFLAGLIHSRSLREIPYDRLVCISNQVRELALAVGVAPEQTVAIPVGIDPDVFVPTTLDRKTKESLGGGAPLILCVAGVVPHKGQLDMVEAMPTIAHYWPGARYVNIGAIRDRHYYAQVKSRTRELEVEDRCLFLGHVPFKDLLLYYNACDIYVQPSRQEGFCMAALQAISCGKTIVGTPVGAMAEFIQESQAGVLVPCESPMEIADAVVRLLGSPISVDPYSQHSYVAQNYSWQAVAQKIVALYQSARLFSGAADGEAM
jgi:glycosyltransferase involved in cell wall biosynthesis